MKTDSLFTSRISLVLALLLSAAGVSWPASQARAGDILNLEKFVPTRLTDAYPVTYMDRQVELAARYGHSDSGENRYFLLPRVFYGFARGAELDLSVPVRWGGAAQSGSGDISLASLYQFNDETRWLPVFSVLGGAEFPTGKDSHGVDTTLTLLVSKTISWSSFFQRVHLNLSWKHNGAPLSDERIDRYEAILGYQSRISASTQFVADFDRDLEIKNGDVQNILEAGIRYEWNPLWIIGLGAGTSFGPQAQPILATLSFQHAVNAF